MGSVTAERKTKTPEVEQSVALRFLHSVMVMAGAVMLGLWSLVLPHGDSGDAFREQLAEAAWYRNLVLALWLVIALESVLGWFASAESRAQRWRRLVLILLVPPLRMTMATSVRGDLLWFPFKGWQLVGERTSLEVERRLAIPMLLVTLLVLPVLAAEFGLGEVLDARPRLALAVHLATCVIWTAFAFEFIWMISVTRERWRYVTRHVIHLVIIFLPMLAFIRLFRLLGLSRVVKAGRLLRITRLRGLATRLIRAILLFELADRWRQRNPEKMRQSLLKQIEEAEAEVARLRSKLRAVEARMSETTEGPADGNSTPIMDS
jgi:voltage-gated potassium channel